MLRKVRHARQILVLSLSLFLFGLIVGLLGHGQPIPTVDAQDPWLCPPQAPVPPGSPNGYVFLLVHTIPYGVSSNADGDEERELLMWYNGAPGGKKNPPLLLDVLYDGACGGDGQPRCDYHFAFTEDGRLLPRNPTTPKDYWNVVYNLPFFPHVTWHHKVGQPCEEDNGIPCPFEGGNPGTWFSDADIEIMLNFRLGSTAGLPAGAFLKEARVTSRDPQSDSSGLKAVDRDENCPVFSAYEFLGESYEYKCRDERPLSWTFCLPYRFAWGGTHG